MPHSEAEIRGQITSAQKNLVDIAKRAMAAGFKETAQGIGEASATLEIAKCQLFEGREQGPSEEVTP